MYREKHKTSSIMKALDFLTITSKHQISYSTYLLFTKDTPVTVDMFGSDVYPAKLVSGAIPDNTAIVAVYADSEPDLLWYMNDAKEAPAANILVEDEKGYFVFIYSLE